MKSSAISLIRLNATLLAFLGGSLTILAQDWPCKLPGVEFSCEQGQQAICGTEADKVVAKCRTTSPSAKSLDNNLREQQAPVTQGMNARYSATARFLVSSPYGPMFPCYPSPFYHRGSNEEAQWRSKVHEQPNNASYHYNLGRSLRDVHKLAEAEKEFRFIVDLPRPNPLALRDAWPSALYALGVTLFEQGKYPEAYDVFQRFIELSDAVRSVGNRPNSVLVRYPCDLYMLAVVQAARGNHKDAEAILGKTKPLPDDPSSILLLASLLYDQGRFTEAEAAYRQVLTFLSEVPQDKDLMSQGSFLQLAAKEGLVVALLKQGKYADSAASTEAMSYGRRAAWEIFRIGLSYMVKGKFRDAERMLRQATALEPTNMIFSETLEIVKTKN